MAPPPRIQFLFEPARALRSATLAQLSPELRAVAQRARPEAGLPRACEPGGLVQRVLALARERDGGLCGFASARLLPVPGLGEALHLEEVRAIGSGREALSARLALAAVRGYCLRFSFPARLWCVFDSSGPCQLGEAVDSQCALGISCAVDEVARRLTRPSDTQSERWAAWLAGVLTPVVRFELGGRVLETGFVGIAGLVGHPLRRRANRLLWPAGSPAPI